MTPKIGERVRRLHDHLDVQDNPFAPYDPRADRARMRPSIRQSLVALRTEVAHSFTPLIVAVAFILLILYLCVRHYDSEWGMAMAVGALSCIYILFLTFPETYDRWKDFIARLEEIWEDRRQRRLRREAEFQPNESFFSEGGIGEKDVNTSRDFSMASSHSLDSTDQRNQARIGHRIRDVLHNLQEHRHREHHLSSPIAHRRKSSGYDEPSPSPRERHRHERHEESSPSAAHERHRHEEKRHDLRYEESREVIVEQSVPRPSPYNYNSSITTIPDDDDFSREIVIEFAERNNHPSSPDKPGLKKRFQNALQRHGSRPQVQGGSRQSHISEEQDSKLQSSAEPPHHKHRRHWQRLRDAIHNHHLRHKDDHHHKSAVPESVDVAPSSVASDKPSNHHHPNRLISRIRGALHHNHESGKSPRNISSVTFHA